MITVLQQFKDMRYEIEPLVFKFLKDLGGARIIVACSGGSDSVFLLYLLKSYEEELQLDIIVAHYNHKWRAESSDQDCHFVQKLSQDLGLVCCVDSSHDDSVKKNETYARNQRIAFLRKIAQEKESHVVAFGHQCDDVLETQIQRLGRGASLDGLIAPRPIHKFEQYPTHIRPILRYQSNFIQAALKKVSAQWREDSSNKDETIVRNKLRHSIIPELSQLMKRNVSESASRSRYLLEQDANFLNELAKERLKACYDLEPKLDRLQLRSQEKPLTRRAFFYWLNSLIEGDSVSSKLQDQILEAIYGDRFREKFSVGRSFVVMNKRYIWIEDRS
jgi:tRNA(Ile)-lysidine synthase